MIFLYYVVLCNIEGEYLLRYIIFDVPGNANLEMIKNKYYLQHRKISTDEFHLCNSDNEMKELLSKYKIKGFDWN